MNTIRLASLLVPAIIAFTTSAISAPTTIVFVSEYDKGASAEMATDHGLDMANMKMPSDMGLRLSLATVNAGDVLFKVKNTSAEMTHQILVFPYVDGKPYAYNPDFLQIDEKTAQKLGEVSETEPGKSGELKLTLAPGKYALLCNIPGHFANGMWAVLTVK
jgi:uncharacterized cupredoxin-like copper-binding protein